jgi:hypothetical protein
VGDVFYYLRVLYAQFFPWVLLLPWALVSGVREALRGAVLARLLVASVLVATTVYTIVPTKLPWYLVPIYPAAAVLVASVVAPWLRARSRVPSVWPALAAAAAFLIARPVDPYGIVRQGLPETMPPLSTALAGSKMLGIAALLAILFGLLAVAMPMRRGTRPAVPALLGVCGLFVVAATTLRPALTREEHGVARLARLAAQAQPRNRGVLLVFPNDDHYPSTLFYSDRPVSIARDGSELSSLIGGSTPVTAIVERDALAGLAECCTLAVAAESGPYVYGVVTLRRQS